jgi:hypothetical protein
MATIVESSALNAFSKNPVWDGPPDINGLVLVV